LIKEILKQSRISRETYDEFREKIWFIGEESTIKFLKYISLTQALHKS
jgi:hypothetical protein